MSGGVPTSTIIVNERIRRDMGDLEALAASIRERQQLQPIVVTPERVLLAGERRLRACELLGTPVLIRVIATAKEALAALDVEAEENLQRKQVGEMLREWEKRFPGRIENMFTAMGRIVPSHLMDSKLHDFKNLKTTGVPDENGDKAFDKEEFAPAPTLPGVQVVQIG